MDVVNIQSEELLSLCLEVFNSIDVEYNNAQIISNLLVNADLRGVSSHGVMRLPIYAHKAKKGLINAKASLKIVNESSSSLLYDGDNGFGQINALKSMQECISRSKENGICVAGIRNSNNFGSAGQIAMEATRHGNIGIVISNASPTMVPFGGATSLLGTNPLAIAVPGNTQFPIVLDIATSSVARDKIRIFAKENKSIPEGWAIDKNGKKTTDANEALKGSLLPMAGHKGYGIALMIDILTGVLAGGEIGHDVKLLYDESGPSGVSHFVAVIDINSFMPYESFENRLNEYCSYIKSSTPQEGFDEILLPGELEYKEQQKRKREGIPISNDTLNQLQKLSEEFELPKIV